MANKGTIRVMLPITTNLCFNNNPRSLFFQKPYFITAHLAKKRYFNWRSSINLLQCLAYFLGIGIYLFIKPPAALLVAFYYAKNRAFIISPV